MKKVIIASLIACVALLTQASELYWMVSNTGYDGGVYTTSGKTRQGDDTSFDWDMAVLYANDGSGMKSVMTIDAIDMYDGWDVATYSFSDTYDSSYSFKVELYMDEQLVGEMENAVSYNTLKSAVSITGSMTQSASPYTFDGFVNVPEPTSGLLMLLGLAALGLKRGKNRA